MSIRVGAIMLMVAFALPQVASAQAVTTFDGVYQGVSTTADGGRGCVPAIPVPRPLTIKNGAAQFAGGLTGDTPWQGTVTAQGSLTMRNDRGNITQGNIVGGKITLAGSGTGATSCTITSIWQK